MRLAVMQPYLLPYLGYFQLIAAADKFVLYDDVHFIKRGWINRNRLLLDGEEHLFTVPLQGASQNRAINEIELDPNPVWRRKLVRTMEQAYRRAPHFSQVFPIVRKVLSFPECNLSAYLRYGLDEVMRYLNIRTELVPSSTVFANAQLRGQERILDICRATKAEVYINAPGGRELYDPQLFRDKGVALRFLESDPYTYKQFDSEFRPSLSIVDVLMFNAQEEVRAQLGRIKLQP